MKRGIKIGVLFCMIMLLMGQMPQCKRANTETAGSGATSFTISGTQGIELKFLDQMPPTRIYSTSDLPAVIELWNKGTYDVMGDLYLGGHDEKIVRFSRTRATFGPLEARSRNNVMGGYDSIDMGPGRIFDSYFTDVYKPKIIATVCYDYQTEATPAVCIDPNLYDLNIEEKACVPGNVAPHGGSQGAPVAVSNVFVETFGTKVSARIDISNAGKGKVVVASPGKCPYNLEYMDLNLVNYDVTLSGVPGDCKPLDRMGRYVRLVNNKASVFCTFNLQGDKKVAYTTTMQIKLRYGYMESISKDVEIIKVSQTR